MRTMNIGRLNKRVTIMKKDDTRNALNQKSKGFVDIKTVWASLYPVRGAERYELQKLHEEITWKCYMRYVPDVRADMYLKCEGKTFEIQSVIDVDFEHKMLELDVVEKIVKTKAAAPEPTPEPTPEPEPTPDPETEE